MTPYGDVIPGTAAVRMPFLPILTGDWGRIFLE